jgi:hypothetical protein
MHHDDVLRKKEEQERGEQNRSKRPKRKRCRLMKGKNHDTGPVSFAQALKTTFRTLSLFLDDLATQRWFVPR